MAHRRTNCPAAELLHDLRVDRGLSPEALSWAIYQAGHGDVSGRTIRRIEETGMVPTVRIQFAIATFFERSVLSIWPARPTRSRVGARS